MVHHQCTGLFISHMQQGNFNSSVGPDGYMLSAVTCGMSPVTSITEGLQQVKLGKIALSDLPKAAAFFAILQTQISLAQIVTMGLFRTIALFYLGSFDSIVRRCMIQREQSKAADKRE